MTRKHNHNGEGNAMDTRAQPAELKPVFCPVCARRLVKGVQCRHGLAPERAGLYHEADDICPPGTVMRDGMFIPLDMLGPDEEPYPSPATRRRSKP